MCKSHLSETRTPNFVLIFWYGITLKKEKSQTHVSDTPQVLVLNFITKRCVSYMGGYGYKFGGRHVVQVTRRSV